MAKIKVVEAPTQDISMTITLENGHKLTFDDINEPELVSVIQRGLRASGLFPVSFQDDQVDIYHLTHTAMEIWTREEKARRAGLVNRIVFDAPQHGI